MPLSRFLVRTYFCPLFLCAAAAAQVSVAGRVVGENGEGIAGARVELRRAGAGTPAVTSSDAAGNFGFALAEAGEYEIRAERQGYFLFHSSGHRLGLDSTNQLTITLNRLQEFTERIDVTYSPPAIDPQEPAEIKELENIEVQTVPFPASQDYRSALPMLNGIVQDHAGRLHFDGASTNQTSFRLNGFNISDPVNGRLEARVNVDGIQSMEVESSRFSADSGRGSAGSVDLKTKMGDDRWRFGGTNFVPGVSTQGGLHLSKWSPRLEFSGPVLKSRAWFHNAFDAFYDADTVSGLPRGENRTQGLTTSDLTRFQINITPANILIGSFLFNLDYDTRAGLSILNPAEATSSHRQTMYMSSVRDQHYFAGGGALLEVGFADTRIALRNLPHGSDVYQMTPYGNRGNYFVWTDRHSYRRQLIANLFLPTVRFHGVHQLKFGVDSERTSFHQVTVRHQYEILRADNSIARRVSFLGGPFQGRKNLDAAHYVQDHWNLREGLSLDAGIRVEWNEVVRNVQLGPRFAAVWAPSRLRDTKFSLGWGAYYDAISLELIARQQDQMSLATYFSPSGLVRGPVGTYFRVNDHALTTPRYQTLSATLERKLPAEFYMRAGYTRRSGSRGFTFSPSNFSMIAGAFYSDGAYDLTNSRRERYDAFDLTLRHTFAGQFEWFAGYTRSSSRSNAAVEYSLENPVFSVQMPGPVPWDAPNRFHTWGWAPVPKQLLPKFLNFAIRNTTLAYLVEYRSGFPFGVVDEEGTAVGAPNSWRFPDYFNINLSFERRFRAMHYQWAWRFGFNNITNNGNPNVVNNVIGTPQFLAYGRGQARAFNVRLRFLGRR